MRAATYLTCAFAYLYVIARIIQILGAVFKISCLSRLMYLCSFVFISILFFAEFAANYGQIEDEAKPTEEMIKEM